MKPPPTGHHDPSTGASCRRTRLAQSSVASVDRCQCGILQLHVGALTMRFEVGAAHELLGTLRRALEADALTHVEGEGAAFSPFPPKERGRA